VSAGDTVGRGPGIGGGGEGMKIVAFSDGDTPESIFRKLNEAELAELDEHFDKTGTVYRGTVPLRIEMTKEQLNLFVCALSRDMANEAYHNRKFLGIPIIVRN
jgi:hypothetical protein